MSRVASFSVTRCTRQDFAMFASEEGSHDWDFHLLGHLGFHRRLRRRIYARLLVIERRRFRRKSVNPTDTEFKQTHVLVTIGCVLFGSLFLAVALLSSILGDEFVNTLFHSFGG
jgi:preprotein translocase subunit Sss1